MIMIPPNRSVSWLRILALCCSAVTFATGFAATNEKVLRLPDPSGGWVEFRTVDWYKEPPNGIGANGHINIECELIVAVPQQLHHEAMTLIGANDAIEITKERAKHFGFRAEPDSVLRSLIQQSEEDRQRSERQTAELRAGAPNMSPERTKQTLQLQKSIRKGIDAKIERYQGWTGQLKPYLIKAVSFFDKEESFSGRLNREGLVIEFGAALGRNARMTMKRMPAVVYLPQKPPHVYTEMGNMY